MIFMARSSMGLASLGGLGQQRDGAGAADGAGQLPLVPRAAAGDAARGDLAPLRNEVAQAAYILVVDQIDAIDTELANLAASEAAPLDRLR
jgi:hypothetical protein